MAGEWNGRDDLSADEPEILRPYTPASVDPVAGKVELVIKVYKGGVNEKFVDGGKMSQYMDTLKVGDTLDIEGPIGMNEYMGKGLFKIGRKEMRCTQLGMMAGGTGLTPMLQVIAAVLKEPAHDAPTMSLLLANQTEGDILVRETLEALQAKHPERLHLWFTLDRPPADGWAYSTGFITAEMIAAHLPPPGEDTLVLMCGPPPMVKFACQKNLDALGYPAERQICF